MVGQSDSTQASEGNACATESHAAFLDRSYFAGLDGIRCLAITAVIWHHTPGRESLHIPILIRGYLGVDLFFVLSGFLITTILIRESKQTGTISLRNFYARRSLRIFPLYYGFLFVLAVWSWCTDRQQFADYTNVLPYYLLYLTNFVEPDSRVLLGQAWSLAVEEQFYLVWPTMIKLMGMRRAGYAIAGIVLGLSVIAMVPGDDAIHTITGPFKTILVGCLLAIILDSKTGFRQFHWIFGRRSSVAWSFVALTLLLMPRGDVVGAWEILVHLAMAGVVGSIVINPSNSLMPILTLPAVKTIGVVSYGIYLTHAQITGVVMRISDLVPGGLSMGAFFLIFLAISTCVAYVIYHGFEVHFLKLKRHFVSKSPKLST